MLVGQADIRFLDRRYNLDYNHKVTTIVTDPDRRGAVRWEEHLAETIDMRQLDRTSEAQARFTPLEAPLTDARLVTTMSRDFEDWIVRSTTVTVKTNQALKIFAGPEVSTADFRTRCTEQARKSREAETKKATDALDNKIDALQLKLTREERELAGDQTELSQRKLEEGGNILSTAAGLFGLTRKKSVSTAFTKRRMTTTSQSRRRRIQGYD